MDHHIPQQTDLTDIPNRFAEILFNQASLLELVLVGMIVALGLFIHKSETSAKQERARNQEKFENLIIRTRS